MLITFFFVFYVTGKLQRLEIIDLFIRTQSYGIYLQILRDEFISHFHKRR